MANAKDEDSVFLYSISQDVGPDDRHLAPSAANYSPPLGKFRQAVGDIDEALAQRIAAVGLNAEM